MMTICQRLGMGGAVAATLFGAVLAGQAASSAQMSAAVALKSFASVEPAASCSQDPQQKDWQKDCAALLPARRASGHPISPRLGTDAQPQTHRLLSPPLGEVGVIPGTGPHGG